MFLPLIFSLALRMDFNADLEKYTAGGLLDNSISGIPEHRLSEPVHLLPGAVTQTQKTNLKTEYKAIFVPSKLQKYKGSLTALGIFYGPILMTGAPFELSVIPVSQDQDLRGSVRLRMSSLAVPILTLLAFFVFFMIVDTMTADPRSFLKFLVGFSLVWLVYSLVVYLAGGLISSGIQPFFNELLAPEQRPAKFSPVYASSVIAPSRVFLIGMFYWVIIYLFRKAKAGGGDAIEAKPGRATVE